MYEKSQLDRIPHHPVEKKRKEELCVRTTELCGNIKTKGSDSKKETFTARFSLNEYQSLFERALSDLLVSFKESVELNVILSKLSRKPSRSQTQKMQENFEMNFRTSLANNVNQQNSIRKFMVMLFKDLIQRTKTKEVD